ncbi:hypothetical protein ACFL2T_00435 [Elusimicrobiota bacterium]
MRYRRIILGVLIASFAFVADARTEVTITDIGWQLALQVKKKRRAYHDIERWLFPPSPNVKLRPRAVVSLTNKNPRAESAVLLRYSFSARLRKIGEDEPGIWTLPFLLEERHIPRIAANTTKEFPLALNRVALGSYLKRMYRSGHWPDAFRVRVMVEPRAGEGFKDRFGEKLLSVVWRSNAPGPASGADAGAAGEPE